MAIALRAISTNVSVNIRIFVFSAPPSGASLDPGAGFEGIDREALLQKYSRHSGRNQSVDNVFDVGFKFFTAQTGRLLLSLELQKSKVNRVDQPRLVPGLFWLHAHLLKRKRQVLHSSVRHTLQYGLHVWMARRSTQLAKHLAR